MERITASTTIEELAAIVSTALEAAGIGAVLSGGAVVSIYAWAKREGAVDKLEKFKQLLVARQKSQ